MNAHDSNPSHYAGPGWPAARKQSVTRAGLTGGPTTLTHLLRPVK